jgi:competence protein ComEC
VPEHKTEQAENPEKSRHNQNQNEMKLFLAFLMSLLIYNGNAQMRVHLINVGQGCATLVEFPCAAILIDTGGETDGQYNSSEALKAYLDDFFARRTDLNHTLKCVYLTHPHKDHTLGVPAVLTAPYVIKNAVTDGLEEGSGKAGQIKLHRAAQDSEDNSDPSDDIGFEAVTTAEVGNNGITNGVIDAVNCTGTDPIIKILGEHRLLILDGVTWILRMRTTTHW